jgi:hypothetical protein
VLFSDFDVIFLNLRVWYKEQAISKRNLLFVWPIYTISALVIRMYDVFDGTTMDINY